MDAAHYLGFTLTGFHDPGLADRPRGGRHPFDGDPGVAPEVRRLVDAARALEWDAGLFHSGDGYLDHLLWRPIAEDHEIPLHIAGLLRDPAAAREAPLLGIDEETFLILPDAPHDGFDPERLAGIDVLLDPEAFDRVQKAWSGSVAFPERSDPNEIAQRLEQIAAALHRRALEASQPTHSLADTMFDL